MGAWGALLALAAWIRWLHPAFLALSAAGVFLALYSPRLRQTPGAFGVVALVLAIVAGFIGDREVRRVATDWEEIREQREAQVQSALDEALDRTIRRGDETVERVLELWEMGGGTPPEGPDLARVRDEGRMDALAVFGPDGELRAWDGSHHGRIPAEVRRGETRYAYAERPLLGYLYFTAPLPEGEGAVLAARLLRAELPPTMDSGEVDLASAFQAQTGATVHISSAERVEGASVWDLRWDGETLFSVALAPFTQAEDRDGLVARWGGGVAVLGLLAWLLLARGARFRRVGRAPAAFVLLAFVSLLPLGTLLGFPALFSPADFLLPGPLELTLGRLLVLGAVGAMLVGFLRPPRSQRWQSVWAMGGALVVAGVIVWLFRNGAATGLLAGGDLEWTGYAMGMGLFLSLAAAVGLGPGADYVRAPRPWLFLGVVVVVSVLSVLLSLWVRQGPEIPLWFVGLWALPLWLFSRTLPGGDDLPAAGMRWVAAVVLGVGLALPFAFGDRVTARMALAEGQVERLGTQVDPYMEFLLHRLGEEAGVLLSSGRAPVEVLYGAWVRSGLAWEGYPIWLTHWSDRGMPVEELRLGAPGERPTIPADLVEEADAAQGTAIRRFDLANAHYMAVVSLDGGERITAVVPPRRHVAPVSPLGPLLGPDRTGRESLVLIPLLPGEAPGETGEMRWIATEDGWQAELYLAYPDQVYHAHYLVDLPGTLVVVARGTLITLLLLAVLLSLWFAGRWIGGRQPRSRGRWRALTASFQTRVTLALFGFFLLPTAVFGTMAYQTLHGAAIRTAEVLAERAVEDASGGFVEFGGEVEELAGRVGADLLLYDRGELVEASLPALAELGLYPGWLPRDVHRLMEQREELMVTLPASLGGWDYVMAYRRVAGEQVLAAPAPVEVGATALRQREVTHLLGFALVLGAALSVLLSLVVGRALSRPIQTLQVASERVGAGNLGVHLPEDRKDEFGAVFTAFNRMVRRLRRARKALVRSTRRSRAIVEEVATGVLALDADARVVLANPMAERLLGVELPAGTGLSEVDGELEAGAFFQWLQRYFREELEEESQELHLSGRRIRVRARRISGRGPRGGAVVSLEDVTDELRSERILAWGEMARQVAHEVKNPLTPIKLGVQHIRRAWRDRHPDYTQILERNAEAILGEIDRLASVASGFSRFAAPGAAGELPLEPVGVDAVVRDVLTLYSAGDGEIDFSFRKDGEPTPVRAREGEFKEVLVNLLENSRAAISNGGEVRIQARTGPREVEVTVADDGVGIPPDALPRVFEPHFSTRSSGTGLGLAIVRRLVESWGGEVEVESEWGAGTTVRLRLVPWVDGLEGTGEQEEKS